VSEKPSFPDLSLSLLERTFPRTFHFLSDQEKGRLAKEFGHRLAGELQKFPLFLLAKKWPADRGFIPELAGLEIAMKIAAVAPDIERRGFEGVTTASEPEWYSARFRFDPAHRVVDSGWPLCELLGDAQELPSPRPCTVLIYRSEGKALARELGANEALLIRTLDLGVPLGRVLEKNYGPDFDARTFHRWIESGLLRAIDWSPV
jgi:hypothetical protein